MSFIQACDNAIKRASATVHVCRVYKDTEGNFYTLLDSELDPDNGSHGWLFQAYPGGRKVLSLAGVSVCNRLGIKV